MYFPTSVARQFCTVPSLPNATPEPVLGITPSPHRSLFCTLTRDGIAIWRVRVRPTFARLNFHPDTHHLALGHPHVSFKNIDEREGAWRKPICSLVHRWNTNRHSGACSRMPNVTSCSLRSPLQTSKSYLVLASLRQKPDEIVYGTPRSGSSALRTFLPGPGEALPLQALVIHFEGVIRIEGSLLR